METCTNREIKEHECHISPRLCIIISRKSASYCLSSAQLVQRRPEATLSNSINRTQWELAPCKKNTSCRCSTPYKSTLYVTTLSSPLSTFTLYQKKCATTCTPLPMMPKECTKKLTAGYASSKSGCVNTEHIQEENNFCKSENRWNG